MNATAGQLHDASNIIAVPYDTSPYNSTKKMSAGDLGALFVERYSEFVGILTERDVARKVNAEGCHHDAVSAHHSDVTSGALDQCA